MTIKKTFPHILLAAYVILFIACAINPYSREVWIAENIPIVLIVLVLAFTYRYYRFSNAAYALMAILVFLHTIGGYYTFERVPFGFITTLFGFTRNNYDRVAHFSVGLYAFAIAELLYNKRLTTSRWVLWLFPIFAIGFVAAGYEIIEWLYAAFSDPTAGVAFLGSQGDVWDAQKDMLSDILGAIVASSAYVLFNTSGEKQWKSKAKRK